MALPATALQEFFDGTQTELTAGQTVGTLTDGAFSNGTTDIDVIENSDQARAASFVLKCQWATVTGIANTVVNLHARPLNIEVANDAPVPSANNLQHFIQSFVADGDVATSTNTYLIIKEASLIGMGDAQDWEFYLENQTGQTIALLWQLWIRFKGTGPKA